MAARARLVRGQPARSVRRHASTLVGARSVPSNTFTIVNAGSSATAGAGAGDGAATGGRTGAGAGGGGAGAVQLRGTARRRCRQCRRWQRRRRGGRRRHIKIGPTAGAGAGSGADDGAADDFTPDDGSGSGCGGSSGSEETSGSNEAPGSITGSAVTCTAAGDFFAVWWPSPGLLFGCGGGSSGTIAVWSGPRACVLCFCDSASAWASAIRFSQYSSSALRRFARRPQPGPPPYAGGRSSPTAPAREQDSAGPHQARPGRASRRSGGLWRHVRRSGIRRERKSQRPARAAAGGLRSALRLAAADDETAGHQRGGRPPASYRNALHGTSSLRSSPAPILGRSLRKGYHWHGNENPNRVNRTQHRDGIKWAEMREMGKRKEPPAAIAGPSPLPGQVAPRYRTGRIPVRSHPASSL